MKKAYRYVWLYIIILTMLGSTGCTLAKPASINEVYNSFTKEFAANDPEVTAYWGNLESFGIEKKEDKLPYASDADRLKQLKSFEKNLKIMQKYKDSEMDENEKLTAEILKWYLNNQLEGKEFMYHEYVVNQFYGPQVDFPEFLTNVYEIKNKQDAEQYIQMLAQFGTTFEQVIADVKVREKKGILPPASILYLVKRQCNAFKLGKAKYNVLYKSFKEKLEGIKDITSQEREELYARAEKEINDIVYPAYDRMTQYMGELEKKSTIKGGIWELPDGDQYYAYLLKKNTLTDLTPEEVHQLGLKEVDRIVGEIQEVLKQTEYKNLSLKQSFTLSDKSFSGKEIFEEYKNILKNMESRLPEMFDILPKTQLEMEAVPVMKQNSGSNYYMPPALDNSRPGTIYFNLGYNHQKNEMMPLAFHEGIPGHHLQLTIQTEQENIPVIRKLLSFTAFEEGWALYAEKLGDEYGFYDEPFLRLGYLQSELMRAARLVVDTGLHYKKWSKEEAIQYMNQYIGFDSTSEIERYLVMPGQACAYKVGELKILELREKAKLALGDRFDIKEFHNVVLQNGEMPFSVLTLQVDNYIKSKK